MWLYSKKFHILYCIFIFFLFFSRIVSIVISRKICPKFEESFHGLVTSTTSQTLDKFTSKLRLRTKIIPKCQHFNDYFWAIQQSSTPCTFIFFFFSRKVAHHRHFGENLSKSLRSHATASWPQREIWGGEKWPQRNEQRLWKHCQSHKQRSKSTLQKKTNLIKSCSAWTFFIKQNQRFGLAWSGVAWVHGFLVLLLISILSGI